MSRGRKTVTEGKGPAPQEEQRTVDKSLLMEMFRELKEDINSRFIEMKDFEESIRERLDGLQQQLSHLALEKSEEGEKTDEREEDAVVNGGHGDTPFNRGNESPSACAREEPLFSNNKEQGHLVLFKSGTLSRRQIADSRRSEISSGELYSSNMQSVAERTVFQKVPLAESDTAVAVACSSSGEKIRR